MGWDAAALDLALLLLEDSTQADANGIRSGAQTHDLGEALM